MGPIDTHAHLADLDGCAAVTHARAAGLSGIVAVSASISTCENTIKLAQKHQGFVHAALGIHPTEIFDQDLGTALEIIKRNASSCVAIGEIGLDYWHRLVRKDTAKKERQIEYYIKQLQLARELELPVTIHSRGAWGDCVKLASEYGPGLGVFHWYSGPLATLVEILDLGYYVSCTPALESSRELRMAIEKAPLERILVETDSPVWIKSQNRASQPADLLLTLEQLAKLKELPFADIEATTTRNAQILFKLRTHA